MKKSVVLLLVFVLCLAAIGVASADKLQNWTVPFTYDVPAAAWGPGPVSYSFAFAWTYPEPGGTTSAANGEFVVDEDDELYPGYVVMRGFFGVYAKPRGTNGRECIRIDEPGQPVLIHPDQPVRFHMGWRTNEPMTAVDAHQHIRSMTTTVDWGDGPL